MNIWLSMLTTTGLGAIIGGFTNHLAIKMLFRPHRPMYIGKFSSAIYTRINSEAPR